MKAVAVIGECKTYTSQHLDSLRRDFFLFKGTAWAATIRAVAEISECKTYASQHLDSLRRSRKQHM